ncbi:MAG: hypothetical protein GF411_05180 [Candidatus Lokiarchaeota archaeon]|nr:hypothetical protein [Candidatus Lokiarchaeota archaeon]
MSQRTSFEETIKNTLEQIKEESPTTIHNIAESTGIDWRAIERAVNFFVRLQDEFASHQIRVMKGKAGRIVWVRDRLDKIRLPEEIRRWYIQKRFFEAAEEPISEEEICELFPSKERTSVEEVVERIYRVLEIEDNLSVSAIARRAGVNRRTVDRALDIILEIQDQLSEGILIKKDTIIWKLRSSLYEQDEVTIKYFLKKWYFPDEVEELSEEKEVALLHLA